MSTRSKLEKLDSRTLAIIVNSGQADDDTLELAQEILDERETELHTVGIGSTIDYETVRDQVAVFASVG